MANTINVIDQAALRDLYDRGYNKNAASKAMGLAEATVYRYYTKWDALTSRTTFDLVHLDPRVVKEYEIQAGMRRLSVYNFIFLILNTVASDNLFASIVDIEEDHPAKRRLAQNEKS